MHETFYDVMRRQGITRRSFLKYCSLAAAALGLGPSFAPKIAHAMETKPRIPVLWLHGLECTCCSESFIRSAHPLAKDVILSMISLDYDDTIMAAAGHQQIRLAGRRDDGANVDAGPRAATTLAFVTVKSHDREFCFCHARFNAGHPDIFANQVCP